MELKHDFSRQSSGIVKIWLPYSRSSRRQRTLGSPGVQGSLMPSAATGNTFVCKVTLRQYIMFCWHFLTTDMSEALGTRRHIPEERKLHTHRCEDIKIFKIRLILKCALDHSGSNFNESHLHSAADGCESRSVDGLHWLRYCRLSAVLENVETVIPIRPWRSD